MTHFPDALRRWRKSRRFSQLELGLAADVSARHISFLESGRARPSPAMIGRLGDAMSLPLAARNQLLTMAGFAARYPGRRWGEDDMAPVRAAVDHMLDRHAPYPGLAIDRLWRVLRLNKPAQTLFGSVGVSEGDSLVELMVSDTLPPLIENWPEVAQRVAQRLRVESAAQGGLPELDNAAARLGATPGAGTGPCGPVVPTILRQGDLRLSLFATIAQIGTPDDVTPDDLKIELYFPADPATDTDLRAIAAG